MSEVEELRAEVRRLQDLLDENGISYELEQFGPPDRPQFGPPTRLEYLTQVMFKRSVDAFLEDQERMARDLEFFSGKEWPTSLRVRLPAEYKVTRVV